MSGMGRREFITLLGGAATAWPISARAQQPAMPVIGMISLLSAGSAAHLLSAFRRGLAETGYVEGQNVAIEYRLTEGRYDRLHEQATDLANRQVSVIAAAGTPAALAAKAATQSIPIAFGVAEDPVTLGLVASLARPGGNATGINFFVAEIVAKRLGLLRELLPAASRIAVVINPTNVANALATRRDVEAAASGTGMQVHFFEASSSREIDAAFAALVRDRPDAVFVAPDALFVDRRVQLTALAARHALPTAFAVREYVEAGGLMSYGTSVSDMYRHVGAYAGRILKGAKPADLPVVQATKFDLVINLQTARLLGLEVPPTLLARADEVIE
jgi:ABC-type uncharacterized transport system substrate-binding protein